MTWCARMESVGVSFYFFFQAEDGIRDYKVTGVQTCALPIYERLLHRLLRESSAFVPKRNDGFFRDRGDLSYTSTLAMRRLRCEQRAACFNERDRKSVV